jgi:hypothetical protein
MMSVVDKPSTGFELVPCALTDLSDNTVTYARGTLPVSRLPVLVVGIRGRFGNDRVGSYGHGAAMVMAGLEAWDPAAVVLDLTGLVYEWGDGMTGVLVAPGRWYAGKGREVALLAMFGERPAVLPMAVVAADLCRDGLASLIRSEPDLDLPLHDDLASALAAVDRDLMSA